MSTLIETLACLSTTHLTRGTCQRLSSGELGFYANEYGAFVWINQNHPLDMLPKDLRKVYEWAIGQKLDWLKFDPDGQVVPELPVCDWEGAMDWEECRSVTDDPAVSEALQTFSADPTEDNSVFVVQSIARALEVRRAAQ